jgi:energy-coupling factor transport system permease protein
MSAFAGATSIAYRRRASPLHAARGTVAAAYGFAIALAALLLSNPILLGALLLATVAAAGGAGVLRPILLAARWSVLPTLAMCVIVNALVSHGGLTVLARFGDWGVLGQVDPTLEAVIYGLVVGLRLVVVALACLLVVCAADPHDLLRACRRVSPHSALTAAIATRLVSVLAADARRLAEAQRCRPDYASRDRGRRLAILRATVAGALDRSLDIAAVLEMRGYAAGGRARRLQTPRSRHDLLFTACSILLLAVAALALATGNAHFDAYPLVSMSSGPVVYAVAAGLVALAVVPFLDRRGIEQ